MVKIAPDNHKRMTQGTNDTQADELGIMLAELPPAPPIMSSRGLVIAAAAVHLLSTQFPGTLSSPLTHTTCEKLAQSLHDSAKSSSTTGPLLPRHTSKRPTSFVPKYRIVLSEMSDVWCRLMTGLDSKSDISIIRKALQISEVFSTSRREQFTGDEALAILLSRLAYPARLVDMESKWGRSGASISRCVTELGDQILTRWRHVFNLRPSFYTPKRLDYYTSCITAAGSPLPDVWGFIDAKILEICRPQRDQRTSYNGYKKFHALKFQAVVTPDGLMGPVFGPVEGRRADGAVFMMSGLEDACRQYARGSDDRPLFLYGDPAYAVSDVVVSPVRRIGELTESEEKFNFEMSGLRQSVEWGFGNVSNNHAFTDFGNKLRLGLQPVGQLYLLAVLFTNIRTILYSSEASHKFQCIPPSLSEYLVPCSSST